MKIENYNVDAFNPGAIPYPGCFIPVILDLKCNMEVNKKHRHSSAGCHILVIC